MENVPEVIGQANYDNYAKWELKLTQLGYSNFVRILNATDYGIPQSRRRCFMISILGDYNYNFPMKLELKYKLKDFLEKEVDESFFLTPKMYDYCIGKNQKPSKFPRKERFLQSLKNTNEKGIATTITTATGQRPTDNFIICNSYNNKRLNETLKNKTIVEPNLKTKLCNKLVKEGLVKKGDVIRHSYSSNRLENGDKNLGRVENHEGLSPTLDTRCDCLGVVVQEPKVVGGIGEKKSNRGTQWYEQDRIYDENIATAISANHSFHPNYATNLRIRKLTPKECFRLMGFEDDDYTACDSVGLSKSAIYHCAGDSIVTTCLIGLFSKLIHSGNEHIDIIRNYIEKIKE